MTTHVTNLAYKLPLVGTPPPVDELVVIFHEWIRSDALPGDVMIDVADYAHVQGGPGVLLVCHEGHYVIDHGRGVSGLAYHRRRGPVSATPEATAAVALHRLVHAARLLEQRARASFDTTNLEVRALDRLLAPNDAEGWELLESPLRIAIAACWRTPKIELTRIDGDPRQPLTARAQLPARTLSDLAI